jgi:uncharacterized protein YndB with AHSA1/START domain
MMASEGTRHMASIRKEISIQAPAERVWSALKDVGALHTRLVPGFVIDTKLETDSRIVTFGNGQVVRELIVDLDENERRLVWAVVDNPFRHYNASAQVFSDNTGGGCRFVWIADLLPNELRDQVAAMMDQGLSTIKATMEQTPKSR